MYKKRQPARAATITAVVSCIISLVSMLITLYTSMETKKQNNILHLESVHIPIFEIGLLSSVSDAITVCEKDIKPIGTDAKQINQKCIIRKLYTRSNKNILIINDGNENLRKVKVDFSVDSEFLGKINAKIIQQGIDIQISSTKDKAEYGGADFNFRRTSMGVCNIKTPEGVYTSIVNEVILEPPFYRGDLVKGARFEIEVPEDIDLIINAVNYYLNERKENYKENPNKDIHLNMNIDEDLKTKNGFFKMIITGVNEQNEIIEFVFNLFIPYFTDSISTYVDYGKNLIKAYPVLQSTKIIGKETRSER